MKINNGNSKRLVRSGVKTDDWEFKKIKEFIGQTIRVEGFFCTEGKYGEQCVLVGEGVLINMPERAVKEFETVLNNADYSAALLAGKMYIDNIVEGDTNSGKTTFYDLCIED